MIFQNLNNDRLQQLSHLSDYSRMVDVIGLIFLYAKAVPIGRATLSPGLPDTLH
jgi:hypothetical protein